MNGLFSGFFSRHLKDKIDTYGIYVCSRENINSIEFTRITKIVSRNVLGNEIVEILGPIGRSVQSRRRISYYLEERSRRMHILKRWFSIGQLDRRDSYCPDIGPVSISLGVIPFTHGDFRRHPTRRSYASVSLSYFRLARSRKAKIDQLYLSLFGQ